jgi:predicted Zn-dependent protease
VLGAPRYVTLPNAAQLLCADVAWLDSLPGASRSEGPVAWLEHRIWVALLAVLCTVAGVTASYVFVLPRVAERIVSHISPARERDFGERTLRTFDRNLTHPSAADYEDVREVRHGFKILAAELPPEQSVRLEFRSAGALGANALALPGGIVVVTDEMLQVCSTSETVAVLAHELGHVEHRHALRHLLQQSGVSALGGLIGSDASGVALSASALPLALAQAQYSQAFEQDADETGFVLLRKAGYSPELFASCLQKISQKTQGESSDLASYLGSHPLSSERILRAHEAARGFTPTRGLSSDGESESGGDSEVDDDARPADADASGSGATSGH